VLKPDRQAVTSYLVERYLPGISPPQLLEAMARAQASTAQMRAAGTMIRYLGSTFIPTDEACYCLYAAPSVQAVRKANERAAFPFARIVTAVQYPPERSTGRRRRSRTTAVNPRSTEPAARSRGGAPAQHAPLGNTSERPFDADPAY
jgi:hypothetical protein